MNKKQGKIPMIIFGIVLVGGIGWAASQLLGDLFAVGHSASVTAYFLLAIALLLWALRARLTAQTQCRPKRSQPTT